LIAQSFICSFIPKLKHFNFTVDLEAREQAAEKEERRQAKTTLKQEVQFAFRRDFVV